MSSLSIEGAVTCKVTAVSLKWRWCLLVVIATAVFGGFAANAASSAALQASRTATVLEAEVPLGPMSCFDASCNKGAPTQATPPLSIAAVSATVAGALVYAVNRLTKRIRLAVARLPQGSPTVLFRPPQFS
jgi:hypothetical protein